MTTSGVVDVMLQRVGISGLGETVVLTADGGASLPPRGAIVRPLEELHRKRTREPPVLVEWIRIDGPPGYVSDERDGACRRPR